MSPVFVIETKRHVHTVNAANADDALHFATANLTIPEAVEVDFELDVRKVPATGKRFRFNAKAGQWEPLG